MSKSPTHKFHALPISEATKPKQGGLHMVYLDRWWAANDQGLLFYREGTYAHPQCNREKSVVSRCLLEESKSGATYVVQIPLVMVPAKLSDYQ